VKNYDVLVVGSGAGMSVTEAAVEKGLRVALVDKGPLGGTCMNVGCIPSKMLIYPADRVAEIQEARKLGIDAQIRNVNFQAIVERMRKSRQESRDYVRKGVQQSQKLDLYETEAHFVADYTLDVGGEKLEGKKVFIASGSRPSIPPIKGVDTIDYLTNENLLELKELPASVVIIGGGYVGLEYAHFFAGMGTKVTILEALDRLAQPEEAEISQLLERLLRKRMNIYLNTQAEEIRREDRYCTVVVKNKVSGKTDEFSAEKVMIAVGRRSNADLLKVENTGVEVDKRGYVKVDEYLETTRANIFALGDADGQQMFTHVANKEAAIAWHNATSKKKVKMDYTAAPHAIYTHPQVASVGLTEEAARKGHRVLVGRAKYLDVAGGEAMMEEEGFAKAVVDGQTGTILGFHIIGPYAPILIQEVVNAMEAGGHVHAITESMHIHPALTELVARAFDNLEHA